MSRASLALLAAGLLTAPLAASPGELGLGDPAPALQVEWVKGDPIASMSAEGTYVVEFWATWCGPCKKSIPHLTELQHKYADQVAFVGVSVWENDQKNVAPFVEKWGDKMDYRVAMDQVVEGKGRMAESWMQASGARGIPTAFIVQKGKVAWIGHPMEMDEPLAAVVAGTWDLEGAIAERVKKQKGEKLYTEIQAAAEEGKWKEALVSIDALLKLQPDMESYVGPTRYMAYLGLDEREKAAAYGRSFVKGAANENPQVLNMLAWTIVDPQNKDPQLDLELAMHAAERACELTENKEPAILDTLARAYFRSGKVDKAIEVQKKAVELSKGTGWEKELTNTLKEYMGKAKS